MGEKQQDINAIIQKAVREAVAAASADIEDKLARAVDYGTKIGAEIGAEIGAKAAVKAIDREKKKYRERQYDRRYHNTKLLLVNYRQLNEHFKNAVFETEEAAEYDETFYDIMDMMSSKGYDDDIYEKSILESSIRTKIIMTHVNRMLDIYGIMCERSDREDDKRHFRVLKAIYIDDPPVPAQVIADRENVDKRTVYRDIDSAVESLTLLMFGICGIDKL